MTCKYTCTCSYNFHSSMYFEEGFVNGLAQTAILLKVKSVYVGGGGRAVCKHALIEMGF